MQPVERKIKKNSAMIKKEISSLFSFGYKNPRVRNRKELTSLLLDKCIGDITPDDYRGAGVYFGLKISNHRILVVERDYACLVYVQRGKQKLYQLVEKEEPVYRELSILIYQGRQSNLNALRGLRSRL